MAQPFKDFAPVKLWRCLVALNLFIMIRRLLSIAEVGWGWSGETYESVTILIGLCVSLVMVVFVTRFRKHVKTNRAAALKIADEMTVMLPASKLKLEDSAAYHMALYFVAVGEERKAYKAAAIVNKSSAD
jgi:hypothetical protein